MSWTMPVYQSYMAQCQQSRPCQRQCLRDANKCYDMCQYNTQCANMCSEALLQCATSSPLTVQSYYR